MGMKALSPYLCKGPHELRGPDGLLEVVHGFAVLSLSCHQNGPAPARFLSHHLSYRDLPEHTLMWGPQNFRIRFHMK